MKHLLLLLHLLAFTFICSAQDAYHSYLLDKFQNEDGLPVGIWVFGDTETAVYAGGSGYGATITNAVIQNQNFAHELRLQVPAMGSNPWDAGYFISNTEAIEAGDKVTWTFSLRNAGGAGQVNVFAERASDFAKEVILTVPIDINWKTYFISFEARNGSYAPGELNFGFHLAFQQQDVRVGGFTAMNFGSDINLGDLPSDINNENYDGHEPDAAWRAPAQARIESLRMADLTIRAVDDFGNPVEGIQVEVAQQQHEFAFGTAVKACRLAGNNCADATYEEKIQDLDGRGHGFNWVVFENDLKWDGWEERWYESNQGVANAATWLRDRNIGLRGHNLLWPGLDNLPVDVAARPGDTAFVLNRIRNHMDALANYPGLADDIRDWDVINETVTNVSLENAFRGQGQYATGRELYGQVFAKARSAFPNANLYLNDYVTLSLASQPSAAPYQALKRNINELITTAPIDGIGFQAHIGAQLNGIPSVLETFDDFYDSFGLEAKITEFDLPPVVNDSLAGKYLSDLLTATFSHPSMTGFFFWNFWDVDTWKNPSANFFKADWSPKPALGAYTAKVFDEWWTEETVISDASGVASLRGFKGEYTLTYACGDQLITDTFSLTTSRDFTIECGEFIVNVDEVRLEEAVRVFPNPSTGNFTLDYRLDAPGNARLTSVIGEEVWRGTLGRGQLSLSLKLASGVYLLTIETDGRVVNKRVVVE